MTYETVKPDCLNMPLPEGAVILDVRTDIEHRAHCLGCDHVHIPLDQLNAASFYDRNGIAYDRPVYILCKAGTRAKQAADRLSAGGYSAVHVIDGGLDGCCACGVETRRDRSVIPLERQVRIAAGVLIVLGFVLGVTMNPAWHMLSGLVGAGLVFAGVTGLCGMALLIARAPWNRPSPF